VKSFDLIVLGGGSGGLATAQRAAGYGARVAVLEPGRLGGTCVNVGCVPKKVMWYSAELAAAIRFAPAYGFDVELRGHDWATLKTGRDAYVARLNGIYERNLQSKGIEWIAARGRFETAHEVVDANGERYRGEHIVIATGGYPRVPGLPGAGLGITSDGFFELEQRPERVAMVGSGYVAIEFAGVLRALGTAVDLFVRFDGVLRSFDPMLSEHALASLEEIGVRVVKRAVPAALERHGALVLATVDGRRFEGYDAVIWAIGRAPNTAGLALERAGVECESTGFIRVDGYQNTTAPGVYALGDVGGQAELTPVAIAAGRRLADRLFGGQHDRHLSYDLIPTVIFSHPPIGTAGLTEAQARARYPEQRVHAYTASFVPMFHALTVEKPRTVMKLVVVGEDERVIGCHLAGPGADEILQGFAVALSMGARKADLDDTIAIHPTSAEELVTMR
jgi:glutathione reductase (NADPH)